MMPILKVELTTEAKGAIQNEGDVDKGQYVCRWFISATYTQELSLSCFVYSKDSQVKNIKVTAVFFFSVRKVEIRKQWREYNVTEW